MIANTFQANLAFFIADSLTLNVIFLTKKSFLVEKVPLLFQKYTNAARSSTFALHLLQLG